MINYKQLTIHFSTGKIGKTVVMVDDDSCIAGARVVGKAVTNKATALAEYIVVKVFIDSRNLLSILLRHGQPQQEGIFDNFVCLSNQKFMKTRAIL